MANSLKKSLLSTAEARAAIEVALFHGFLHSFGLVNIESTMARSFATTGVKVNCWKTNANGGTDRDLEPMRSRNFFDKIRESHRLESSNSALKYITYNYFLKKNVTF
jgi:hypothetical protein